MSRPAQAIVVALGLVVAITAALLVAEVLALELWRSLTPLPGAR